jgi:hypothetical protein
MIGFLKLALGIVVVAAVLLGIGIVVQKFRQRNLGKWAAERGGTFEAGGLLSGVAVPEAAPFDLAGTQGPGEISYRNVSRIPAGGLTWVVGDFKRTYTWDEKTRSTGGVIVVVSIPGAEFPEVGVEERMGDPGGIASAVGLPGRPPSIPVPGTIPGFAEKFEVRPLRGAGPPDPAALARLLTAPVQELLLGSTSLLANLQTRGPALRLQAVESATSPPHKETLALAERLVALLRR